MLGLPSSAGLPAQALLRALEIVSSTAPKEVVLLVILVGFYELILNTRCEYGWNNGQQCCLISSGQNNSALKSRTCNKRDWSR